MRTAIRFGFTVFFSLLSLSMIIVPAIIHGQMATESQNYLWFFAIPIVICLVIAILCAINIFPLSRFSTAVGESETSMVVRGSTSSRSYGLRMNTNEVVDDDFFYVSGNRSNKEQPTRVHRAKVGFGPEASGKSSHGTAAAAKETEASSSRNKTPQVQINKRTYDIDVGSEYDCDAGGINEALSKHDDVVTISPSSPTVFLYESKRPWRSLEKRRTMPDNMDLKTELEKSNSWPRAYTKAYLEVRRKLDLPLPVYIPPDSNDNIPKPKKDFPLPRTSSAEKVEDWLYDGDYRGDNVFCGSTSSMRQYSRMDDIPRDVTKSNRPNRFVLLGRGYFYACETDDYVPVEPEGETKSEEFNLTNEYMLDAEMSSVSRVTTPESI